MKTMKSAVIKQWHSVELVDVPIPELDENEALVRITYCGICGSDIHLYKGQHPVAKPPVLMGHEMIGIVEKINTNLPIKFKVGDRVTIHGDACGKCDFCLSGAANQCRKRGVKPQVSAGASEYMIGHVDNVIPIPEHISDYAATLVEPFACAVRATDRAKIQTGDTVLVIGGGVIGLVIAFMAREKGAKRVIMSVRGKARQEMAASYGFEVVDAAAENVVLNIMEMTDGEGANVVIEASGSQAGAQLTTEVAAFEATVVMLAVGMEPKPVFDVGSIALKELNIVGSRAHTALDMRRATRFMDVLCRKYDLSYIISDIVPLERIEDGYKMMIEKKNRGKILVKIS